MFLAAILLIISVNAMNKGTPPAAKETNKAGIVATLVSTSNVNFVGNCLMSEKDVYRQQSSNNNSDLMNANLPTPDIWQWRNSSFNFSLNLTSMTMIPLQPGSFVIMKKPLQSVVNSHVAIFSSMKGSVYTIDKTLISSSTSMNFAQMFVFTMETQLQSNSSSLSINRI